MGVHWEKSAEHFSIHSPPSACGTRRSTCLGHAVPSFRQPSGESEKADSMHGRLSVEHIVLPDHATLHSGGVYAESFFKVERKPEHDLPETGKIGV